MGSVMSAFIVRMMDGQTMGVNLAFIVSLKAKENMYISLLDIRSGSKQEKMSQNPMPFNCHQSLRKVKDYRKKRRVLCKSFIGRVL